MRPELKTCLDYCDHGEGTGPDGDGTPYLPTLRGLIVNAVNAETSFLQRQLADETQKVANLEEYMLKGVAFRDELQAKIKRLEEAVEWACSIESCSKWNISISFPIELRRIAAKDG
jgi:hypothetical protein